MPDGPDEQYGGLQAWNIVLLAYYSAISLTLRTASLLLPNRKVITATDLWTLRLGGQVVSSWCPVNLQLSDLLGLLLHGHYSACGCRMAMLGKSCLVC